MEKFEKIGLQIVDFVNQPEQRLNKFICNGGARFIVCGTSGSGKTRAIEVANSSLPLNEQIAESQELLQEKNVLNALKSINDSELEYECSKHIGFNVVSSFLAKDLESQGVKVFWLDNGSSSDHWK